MYTCNETGMKVPMQQGRWACQKCKGKHWQACLMIRRQQEKAYGGHITS